MKVIMKRLFFINLVCLLNITNLNSYIVYKSCLENKKGQQIVFYGDVHDIKAKNQIKQIRPILLSLCKSQKYKSGSFKVYYEGLSNRKAFEKIVLNSKNNQYILQFLHKFNAKNKFNFIDIDARKYLAILDKIYDDVDYFKKNNDQLNDLLAKLYKQIAKDIIYLDKKLNKLLISNKIKTKAYRLIKEDLNLLLKEFDQNKVDISANSDLKTNFKIYENKFYSIIELAFLLDFFDKPKIKKCFVFCGFCHVDILQTMMLELGFEKKYETASTQEIIDSLQNSKLIIASLDDLKLDL